MSRFEKFKKILTIALGFALATYLIMSGMALLEQEKQNEKTEKNIQK